MNKNKSVTASSKLLVALMMATMAMALALTTLAICNQSQQTGNPNNPAREGAPTGTYWAKSYGGAQDDLAYVVQQTSDGGYIVAGSTSSFGAGDSDAWILKLDSTGAVTWEKTYGGSGADCEGAYSVQQTADGGYIVAGHTASFGAGDWDAWILKLDSSGSVTWQKTYGGSEYDCASSVQQTSDGGYIVAGTTTSFGAGSQDAWILKLDSSGSVTWQKTYGGSSSDGGHSVRQTSDGGYIVAGITMSFGMGFYDIWLLKLDSTGTVTWQKTYGGSGNDYAYSVQQTSDGGYIVAGYTNTYGSGGTDAWVLKLDSTGAVTWQKTYGNGYYPSNEWTPSVKQTADGGYIVAGAIWGTLSWDFWVLKLNSTGAVSWHRAYGFVVTGGIGLEEAYSVQQTTDGGYIIAGYTNGWGAGFKDFWVVKLEADGVTGVNAVSWIPTLSCLDSSAAASTTSATLANSAATVQNTVVTPGDTHATVNVQVSPPAVTTTAGGGEGISLLIIVGGVIVAVIAVVLVVIVLMMKKKKPS